MQGSEFCTFGCCLFDGLVVRVVTFWIRDVGLFPNEIGVEGLEVGLFSNLVATFLPFGY